MADRASQFEKALQGLRELVLTGTFDADEKLAETALAERLDVSRTPLRQAFDRLVSEGLLVRNKTGGCRVAQFSPGDVKDSIELRGVMEGTAARLAAERGPETVALERALFAIDAIDSALASSEPDFDAYCRHNAAFHHALARLAGSVVVTREVERLNRLPLASPSAFLRVQQSFPDFRESLHRAQHQHRSLIDAITAREGTRAEAIAREHARLAYANLDFLKWADPDVTRLVPGFSLVHAD